MTVKHPYDPESFSSMWYILDLYAETFSLRINLLSFDSTPLWRTRLVLVKAAFPPTPTSRQEEKEKHYMGWNGRSSKGRGKKVKEERRENEEERKRSFSLPLTSHGSTASLSSQQSRKVIKNLAK